MEDRIATRILQQKGLKITRLRLALLRHFDKMPHAQSYEDIKQGMLQSFDKSTLYRNLSAFEEAGIIHSINDHSGATKYASGESEIKGKEHAHFVCEQCERVYCLKDRSALQISVPDGFKAHSIQTVVKGICNEC